MSSFYQFIQAHLVHIFPLLVVGIVALSVALERFVALFFILPLKNTNIFFDRLRELVMVGNIPEAVVLCDHYVTKPVALIVKRALVRANQPESFIENGLQLALEDSSQRIQKRTAFLLMLANVSTLLGLLGTVVGLITSFQAIGSGDTQERAELLAIGISQAMYATVVGLGVAVPCIILHSIFTNKSSKLLSDIEMAAVTVMDIIKQRYLASEVPNHSLATDRYRSNPAKDGKDRTSPGEDVA